MQRRDDAVFTFRPQVKQPPRTSYKRRRKQWSEDSEQTIRPIPASSNRRAAKQPWAVVRQSVTAPPNMQARAMRAADEELPLDDNLTGRRSVLQPPKLELRGRTRGDSVCSDSPLSANSGSESNATSAVLARFQAANGVVAQEQETLTELRVAYAGNPKWKQGKLGSRVFVPYSRCAQAIVNREHLLVLLQDAVSTLERHYFLYAARRVELAETSYVDDANGATSHLRNLLSVKEETIKRLQMQFRQLLQAVQSATVEVVDDIRAYRAVPGAKVFNQDPTFMWKNQNYLLKMSNDLDMLGMSHVVRLWLGCHPPGYAPRSVDATARYTLGSNALLYVWPGTSQSPFALRNEQMRRLDGWTHFVAASRKAAIARARALSAGDSPSKGSKAGRKSFAPTRQENAVPQITRAASSSTSGLVIPSPPSETPPGSPPLPQASHSSFVDLTTTTARSDIENIRRTCLLSWSERSSIWQDLHETSVVMEAAAGFSELQPKAPLRPTVNIPHAKFQSVLQYIQRERATSFQIAQDAQNMTALRLNLQAYERGASLPTPIALLSDEAASYLVQRRSTPAHQSRSPARRQALSAPQLGSSSVLDTHSFFLTARNSPTFPEGSGYSRNTLRARQPPSPHKLSVAEFCAHIERNDAAIKVQKLVRQWLARRHLQRLRDLKARKEAATAIQSRVRGMLERANTATSRSELQISALEIRNQWKQKYRAGRLVIKAIARLRARRLKRVKMQRLMESETQGPRRVMHNAALDIQRVYRGYLARRRVKSLRARRRLYYAARKINNAARIWLQRRELARESAHLLRSASRHRSLALQKARTTRKGGSLIQPE